MAPRNAAIKALRLVLVTGAIVAWTPALDALAAPAARPPAGLTTAGRNLWNLEALLRETFGSTYRGCLESPAPYVESFTVDRYCATHPSAETLYYSFAFADLGRSAFHLVRRTFPAGAFGNYPQPVRVAGAYVACDRTAKAFLISYGDVLGLSANLACLRPSA